MKTAVVIGGSGFIGTHLTRHLADDLGCQVMVLDLRGPPDLPIGCRFEPTDVRRPIPTYGLPTAPDLVVNLAAVHREPGHDPQEYFDTNVAGARNVIALCEALDARNVVFVSSIAVYGATDEPVDESAPLEPTTAYGRSKVEAEDIHRKWRETAPEVRSLTIARPAAVFGPGEGGNFARLGQALQARRFVYPGRRDAVKGGGYVHDLIRSIDFVQGLPDPEVIYNFSFPRNHTLEEVCEAMSRTLGRRPPRFGVPTTLLAAAGRIGDRLGPLGRRLGLSARRIEKLVSSTNVSPALLGSLGFEYEYDLDSALRHWLLQAPAGRFE